MREAVHGGGVKAVAQRIGVPPEEILDFSSNLNPLGPPPKVLRLLEDALAWKREAIFHPPEYPFRLHEAVSESWGVSEESLVVVPGSVHAIYLLFHLLRPTHTVLHLPTFTDYTLAAQGAGSRLVTHRTEAERGFRLCLGEYSWRIEPGIQVAVLCNPNNPTGYLMPLEEVDALGRWCDREGCYLLIDEAFIEFTSQESAVSLVKEHSHLVVLRSFTKAYAIPGIRVGVVVGPTKLVKMLRRATPPWSVGDLAQEACITALNCHGYLAEARSLVKKEREALRNRLQQLRFKVAPSWANYLLCGLPPGTTGKELQRQLLQRRILLRRCHNIPGLDDMYVRVSVKLSRQNQLLLQALEEALHQVAN